jgi:hypothetical protein
MEGFIYQKIYSALCVENFINNQIKDKYRIQFKDIKWILNENQ